MTQWQSIETAPRDGSLIDVWLVSPPRENEQEPIGHRVIDVFWECAEWPWQGGRWAHKTSSSSWEPMAVEMQYTIGNSKITHWMPQPGIPTQVIDGDGA